MNRHRRRRPELLDDPDLTFEHELAAGPQHASAEDVVVNRTFDGAVGGSTTCSASQRGPSPAGRAGSANGSVTNLPQQTSRPEGGSPTSTGRPTRVPPSASAGASKPAGAADWKRPPTSKSRRSSPTAKPTSRTPAPSSGSRRSPATSSTVRDFTGYLLSGCRGCLARRGRRDQGRCGRRPHSPAAAVGDRESGRPGV